MEHRLRRKQLNSDTNASNKTTLKEIQEKRKQETLFWRKNEKKKKFEEEKEHKNGREKKGKEGPKACPPSRLKKNDFCKEMLQQNLKQLRPKKSDFEQPRKEKEKERKNEDK